MSSKLKRAGRRNSRARIFTFALPVVLVLIKVSLFRNGKVSTEPPPV
jgi:hypothetical protein